MGFSICINLFKLLFKYNRHNNFDFKIFKKKLFKQRTGNCNLISSFLFSKIFFYLIYNFNIFKIFLIFFLLLI